MPLLQVRYGLKASIPSAATLGELLYTIDTKELFVGTGTGISVLTTSSSPFVAHEFVTSYDVSTRTFGATQPSYSDLLLDCGSSVDNTLASIIYDFEGAAYDFGGAL